MAVNAVNLVNTVTRPLNEVRGIVKEKNDGINFSEIFNNAINKTNNLQIESKRLTEDFALGKNDDIDGVLIAAEKSSIALQYTMQIRNKILDAYNEVMRMNF